MANVIFSGENLVFSVSKKTPRFSSMQETQFPELAYRNPIWFLKHGFPVK
jgi:hypothetical protein